MNVLKLFCYILLFSTRLSLADCSKAYKAKSQGSVLYVGLAFAESGSGSFDRISDNLILQSWAMNEYTAGDDYENRWEKLHKSLTLATLGESDPYLREQILDKITKRVGKEKRDRAKELIVSWYHDGTLCPKAKKKKTGQEFQSVLSRKAIIQLAIQTIESESKQQTPKQ